MKKSILLSISLFIIICSSIPLHAEWEKCNGPWGGEITGLIRNDAGELFASASYYGIYKSTDNGQSWQQSEINHEFGMITDLVYADGRLLAPTWFGMLMSADGGASWTSFTDFGGGVECVDAGDGRIFAVSGWKIFISNDNGESWTIKSIDADYVYVKAIKYLGNGKLIAYGNPGGGFISGNYGEDWANLPASTEGIIRYFIASSGRIYAAAGDRSTFEGGDGLYYTDDEGDTWHRVVSGIDDKNITDVAEYGNTLAVSGVNEGVYISTDGGKNWQKRSDGFGILPKITSLEFDNEGNLFAGSYGYGVYKYYPAGKTWKQSSAGIDALYIQSLAINSGGKIFAGVFNVGVMMSTDDGQSWQREKVDIYPHIDFTDIAIDGNGYIYICSYAKGIYRSMDAGLSWALIADEENYNDLVYSPADDMLYAAKSESILWIHANSVPGEWNQMQTPGNISDIAVDPDGGVILTIDNSVYIPTDPDDISAGFESIGPDSESNISVLAVNRFGHIFAPDSDKGVYRSTDRGDSWQVLSEGFPENKRIWKLFIDKFDNTYAASPDADMGGTIYVSTNNGDSWSDISGNTAGVMISALANGPDGEIFLGADGAGLFKMANPNPNAVREIAYERPLIAPNPAEEFITIHLNNEFSENINIYITDIYGRRVKSLSASGRNIRIDIPGLAPGAYFLRGKSGNQRFEGRFTVSR